AVEVTSVVPSCYVSQSDWKTGLTIAPTGSDTSGSSAASISIVSVVSVFMSLPSEDVLILQILMQSLRKQPQQQSKIIAKTAQDIGMAIPSPYQNCFESVIDVVLRLEPDMIL
ncbi:unnamed protein product, partial [Owenia fusiformis]